MITPVQQDARRYLRRWVTIAAAWAIATVVVLVWSIGGRDSGSTADLDTTPTAPTPVTVTAQPAAPIPTLGGPAPTRWPPVPTGTPATFGNVGTTYGAMYRCVNGQPRPGITVDCSQAPPTCDAADSLPWQVVSAEGRLIEDACVNGRQFMEALNASCDTARTATGYVDGRCALRLLPGEAGSDEGGYQMVVLTIACAQSGQGTNLSASCIGKP